MITFQIVGIVGRRSPVDIGDVAAWASINYDGQLHVDVVDDAAGAPCAGCGLEMPFNKSVSTNLQSIDKPLLFFVLVRPMRAYHHGFSF